MVYNVHHHHRTLWWVFPLEYKKKNLSKAVYKNPHAVPRADPPGEENGKVKLNEWSNYPSVPKSPRPRRTYWQKTQEKRNKQAADVQIT